MRKLLFTVAMLLCSAVNAQNTSIELELSGIPDGTVFNLSVGATHRKEPIIQRSTLTNGKVTFAFDSSEPRLYEMTCDNPWGRVEVIADKDDNVKITATGELKDNGREPYYDITAKEITGSQSQNEYAEKNAVTRELNQIYLRINEENKDIISKLSAVERGADEWKALAQTPEYQKFAKAEKDFFDKVSSSYNNLFNQNKGTWWGPFLILKLMNYIPEDSYSLYDILSDDAKNSFYGKALAEQVKKNPTIGTQLADFTFTDHATGKTTTFYEQLKGKRYLLLDFWASWCAPCRREIPNFKSQYGLYKDKGFGIVSISADTKESDWLKALEEEQLPWPNGIDSDKSICTLYNVQHYPTVYVVDSTGKVVAKDMEARGENLRTLLAELFK